MCFRAAFRSKNLIATRLFMERFGTRVNETIYGRNLIVEASFAGDEAAVVFFLERGAEDLTDFRGLNAIHGAIFSKIPDRLIPKLLAAGFSDISATGKSAIHFAILWDFLKSVELLLLGGVPVQHLTHIPPSLTLKFEAAGWRDPEAEVEKPSAVRPLIQSCRDVIRDQLKTDKNIFANVRRLPLPQSIQSFILWG